MKKPVRPIDEPEPKPASRADRPPTEGFVLIVDGHFKSEFDTLDQVLKTAHPEKVFFVPGEHDMLTDNGKQYLDRYGKGTKGGGWYSFPPLSLGLMMNTPMSCAAAASMAGQFRSLTKYQ